MRLYAEGEDIVPEQLKETSEQIIERADIDEPVNFELNDDDKEEMEILAIN